LELPGVVPHALAGYSEDVVLIESLVVGLSVALGVALAALAGREPVLEQPARPVRGEVPAIWM
jgi:hypothetical protein